MRPINADALIERMREHAGCRVCLNYEGVQCRACLWNDAMNLVYEEPTVDGVSKAKVKELIRSGLSLDTDADREYVCGLIDELEG